MVRLQLQISFISSVFLSSGSKTIDNDLGATAFTFGFDSAVSAATDALDRLRTTAASHERIMVLEVMGRHAGWIALHAGLAGGADVILLPEISWDFESVLSKKSWLVNQLVGGTRYSLLLRGLRYRPVIWFVWHHQK